MNYAAEHGAFQCLEELYTSIGLGMSPKAANAAAYGGHINCLKYAYERGALVTQATLDLARDSENAEVIEYITEILSKKINTK
jgi:hypothetical protein